MSHTDDQLKNIKLNYQLTDEQVARLAKIAQKFSAAGFSVTTAELAAFVRQPKATAEYFHRVIDNSLGDENETHQAE